MSYEDGYHENITKKAVYFEPEMDRTAVNMISNISGVQSGDLILRFKIGGI